MAETKSYRVIGLGGCQGLIGWWMVRSGLNTDLLPERQKQGVRVSPYRLATHLTMAFVLIRDWCGAVLSSWAVEKAIGAVYNISGGNSHQSRAAPPV